MHGLDQFYAAVLGCSPEDLNASGAVVVPNPAISQVRIAAGSPLALYAVDKGTGAVFSVRPDLAGLVERVVRGTPSAALEGPLCDAVERALEGLHGGWWFRGIRLYCDSHSFRDQRQGTVRAVTHTDKTAQEMHRKWGGEVFGQIVGGETVAWAAVKPFSDIEWDLRVDTLPDFRGRGYAKSVVSAAVEHIISHGRIAGWGCDRTNRASLRTAEAVGFREYGLDFGFVEE